MSLFVKLRNYLELIDLEDILQEEEQDALLFEHAVAGPYPFTKETLIHFLKSDRFFSSFVDEKKRTVIQNNLDHLSMKQITENISFEKKQEEIILEKRKRYQAYKMLDYTLSQFTYFDFFSADAFQIIKNSKYISQLYGKKRVLLDTLFLPFFDPQLDIARLLNSFGFNETFLFEFSKEIQMLREQELSGFTVENFQNKWNNALHLLFSLEDKQGIFNQNTFYPTIMHSFFEKSAENALTRFKTPVITTEILLITLMEEKQLKISKSIQKNVKNETNWYLLRYKLLKRLYSQESNIRNQVKKNQQFFAYLLKTQLTDISFEKLIEKKRLRKAVSFFRNTLIHELLQTNLFESFDEETHVSLSMAPKRYYSTKY